MRRSLLNMIFSKYPLLGNIDILLELDTEELNQIVLTNDLKEAKEAFKNIIEGKTCDESLNKKVKKNVLLQDVTYYMNY